MGPVRPETDPPIHEMGGGAWGGPADMTILQFSEYLEKHEVEQWL